MPFTATWANLAPGDLDPDSPITTEVMQALYYNADFVSEWMGTRATAAVNHRHRGLATDGTANVDYASLINVAGISAMCTDIQHNFQGAGVNVAFGSPVIGFFPRALILRVGVRSFAPTVDTMSWGSCTPGLGEHCVWISPTVMGAPQGYASQFIAPLRVGYDAGNGQGLICSFLGAPGMGATFIWAAASAGGRYTSIMITAIE